MQQPSSEPTATESSPAISNSLGFTDVFTHQSFAVIDFETTGLSPSTDRILQMAAVVIDANGRVLDSFETIVTPEQPSEYTHGAEHVHGISEDDVRNGMPLGLAMRRLRKISQNSIFTAHNARFDLGFLHAESTRIGQPWIITDYVDTLSLSRDLDPKKEYSHTLTNLLEKYGISRAIAHNALADAKATAELLVVLLAEARQRQNQPTEEEVSK